ncbi:unnamed protein product [Brachionus calyciflorus]|uniref:Endonuclease/exonuclease/phosphatase domain-containing protein n=1 Tax=Brachionus calyciflorus TaxID=104777 RepID=A0A814HGZ0_9BILA|nr:unnamed protein product [Brachionus calyciflorus]
MDLETVDRRGRPHGGKCWIVRKKFNVFEFDFFSPNYSLLKICYGLKNFNFVGVWVPFDNGSIERLVNFISFLSSLESILDVYSNESIIFLGDWNCDLNRGKRFDKLLKNFIINNDLIDCFLLFDQRIDYTYKKKDYISKIDHIFTRSQEIKNIKYYEVIDEPTSLSDHNAVNCFIDLVEDTGDYNEEEESQKDFHYFDWKDQDFVEIYQNFLNKNLDFLFPKVNIDFYNNLSECTSLIDEIYENLPRILLKSAREAEKICKKSKKPRRAFKTNYSNNLEINALSQEINQLYAAFKSTDFKDTSIRKEINLKKKEFKN